MKTLIKILCLLALAFVVAGCNSSSEDESAEGRYQGFLDNVSPSGGSTVSTTEWGLLVDLIDAGQFHRDTYVKSFIQVKHTETFSGQQVCGEFLGQPYYCPGGTTQDAQLYTRNGFGDNAQVSFGEITPGSNGQSIIEKRKFGSESEIQQYLRNFIYSKRDQIRYINPNIPLTNDYASYLVAIATGSQFGYNQNGNLLGRIYAIEFTDGSQLMFSFNLPLWANPIYVRSANLSSGGAGFSEYRLSYDVQTN